MKLNFKRLMAMFLSVMMLISMLPTMVFAAETDETQPESTNVAKIGETSYATLADAVAAATAGDTVTVTADVTDVAVTVDKNLTITGSATLNNVSITANGADVELTVSNLNFTGNSWINANNAAALSVSGVTANVAPVNGSGTTNNATNSRAAFIALGASELTTGLKLTITDNTIVLTGSGYPDPVLGWRYIADGSVISGNIFGSEANPNWDAVKLMNIMDGATITLSDNIVYAYTGSGNGFVFGQNCSRDNAYTVVVEKNRFYGDADFVWIEVSGVTTTHATIKATSDNTVNGKTFTAADIKATSRITTWTSYAGVDVTTDENGKVTGGTLAFCAEDAIAEGYAIVENEDGTYGVATTVYKVATKAELDAAIAAAKDGDTIKLTADIDYAGTASLEINKAITLDLGGYTLTTHGTFGGLALKNTGCSVTNGKLNHAGTVAAIKVWDAKEISDLEIDVTGTSASGNTIDGIVIQENAAGVDLIEDVSIDSTSGQGVSSGIKTYNCGNATEDVIGAMNNVTIDAKDVGMNIYAPCGTATNCSIKGGVSGIEIWIKGTYSASLDLVDCDVTGGTQAVYAHDEFNDAEGVVNDGTITLTADEATTFTAGDDGVLLTKTIARINDEQITLPAAIDKKPVAQIGENKYETLADAFAAAQDDDTVKLLRNASEGAEITIGEKNNGKNITLDLNGKTFTSTVVPSESNTYAFAINVYSGEVTIKNGTIVTNNGVGGIEAAYTGAVLTLEDVTVDANGSSEYNKPYNGSAVSCAANAKIIINSGSYSSEVGDGVNQKNTQGTVIINGGTFTTDSTADEIGAAHIDGVWSGDPVTHMTINGGTFNGYWAFSSTNGTVKDVTINGGTFNGMIDAQYATINLAGGTYTGKVIQAGGHQNKYSITGGTYIEDVTAYVADGYTCKQNDDNTWTVAASYVAQVGETKYETLEAALAEVKANGGTLTLLADVNGSIAFTSEESTSTEITLDLNGHTVTGAGSTLEVCDGYKVTVKDSVGTGKIECTSGDCEAIAIKRGGSVVLESGYVYGAVSAVYLYGTGATGAESFVMNGGTVEAPNAGTAITGNAGTVTINYGTVMVNKAAGGSGWAIYCYDGKAGYIKGGNIVGAPRGTVITGGTFSFTAEEDQMAYDQVAAGYKVVENDNGSYTVVYAPVAAIGETKYATLADAFAAAKQGDTVTLLANITVTEKITVDDSSVLSDITLDGNGKTITAAVNGDYVLKFGDNSTSKWATGVTIKDLTIDGSAWAAIGLIGGTSSNLTNVKVTGEYTYGINFYGTHGATLDNCQIVNAFTNGQAPNKLNLTNGTVITALIANDGATMEPKIFIDETSSITTLYADEHTAMIDVNSMGRIGTILEADTEQPMVAEINGVQYSTLALAIAAAQAGDTVTVIADVADEAVTVDKSITITGEKTLNNVSITASGTTTELTVSNLNFTGSSYINANDAAALTVTGVTANVDPTKITGRAAFIVLGTGEPTHGLKLTVTNNEIYAAQSSTDVCSAAIFGWRYLADGSVISNNTLGSADERYTFIAVKTMNAMADATITVEDNTVYGSTAMWKFKAFDLYQNCSRENTYTVVSKNNVINIDPATNGTYTSCAFYLEDNNATGSNVILLDNGSTVNGEQLTLDDIVNDIDNYDKYYGVNVELNEDGEIIGGNFVIGTDTTALDAALADGYEATTSDNVNYVVKKKAEVKVVTFANAGHNLRLQDLIKIGFYFTATPAEGKTATEVGAYIWADGTAESSAVKVVATYNSTTGKYTAEGNGIRAQELDTMYYAKYYAVIDGVEYTDVVDDYAATEYLEYVYTYYTTGNLQSTRSLVIDLANYAAMAQTYFALDSGTAIPEKLINDFMTDNDKTLNWSDDLKRANPTVNKSTSGGYTATWGGANVNLLDALSLSFIVNNTDVDGVIYWTQEDYDANTTLSYENKSGEGTTRQGMSGGKNSTFGTIPGLYSFNIYDNYYAVMYKNGSAGYLYSAVYGRSIASYASYWVDYYASATAEKDVALRELCKAMLIYGNNAETYFD